MSEPVNLDLLYLLKRQRFALSSEKALQQAIENVLLRNFTDHKREHRLSADSIIDFLVGDTGIEVKISGTSKEIYRQCERYLQFDELKELILVTNKAIRFPEKINNKPVYVLNIGRAWL